MSSEKGVEIKGKLGTQDEVYEGDDAASFSYLLCFSIPI